MKKKRIKPSKDPSQGRTTPEITALWHEFARTKAAPLRDRLIVYFIDFAERQANMVHCRMPAYVEFDDIRSAAMVGLVKAVDGFDPARGVRFETFAGIRIQGAILDDLRAADWVPRSVRTRAAKLAQITDELTGELGREPTRDELIGAAGVSPGEFARMEQDAHRRLVVSIHAELYDEEVPFSETVEQSRELAPDDVAAARDAAAACIAQVPPHMKRTLTGVFFGDELQSAIAEGFGLTEGRVSQWKAEAFQLIRASDVGAELRAVLAA